MYGFRIIYGGIIDEWQSSVIFVPPTAQMDETYDALTAAGTAAGLAISD